MRYVIIILLLLLCGCSSSSKVTPAHDHNRFIGRYFSPGLGAFDREDDLILKEDGTYGLIQSFPASDNSETSDGSMIRDGYKDTGQWLFDGVSVILKSTSGKKIKLTPKYADEKITLSDGILFGLYVIKARQVGPNAYER